jgi:hypothetical protein
MKTTNPEITDSQSLIGAFSRFGHAIPVYDDGFGPLFVHRDSMGISGIVRAQTWEDAYEICEDEFFPEASETVEEMQKEYSTQYLSGRELWDYENPEKPFHTLTEAEKYNACRAPGKHVPFLGEFTEHPCWQEAFGFRPNGRRSVDKDGKDRDPIGHGIYAKDLNGDRLDRLTPELLAELEITLDIEENE